MTRTILIAAALALAITLPFAPAHATGVARTFVSAAGSDSNNCANVATPCRHLATAYAATAANGEIYVLDPANYGSLTITGPVSIEGHSWASIAPVSGNPAITINANPGDMINIIGVVLDGTALTGTDGIRFNSGGSLNIRDSVIRNFSGTGIYFVPNVNSNLIVSNTLVADNGSDGISVFPTSSVAVQAVFDHVEANNNFNNGIGINASRGASFINATASESVAAANGGVGFNVTAAGTSTYLTLFHCVAVNNGTGIETNGVGATLSVEQSNLNRNIYNSWKNSGGGVIFTYGDNYDNGAGLGSLTTLSKF